METPYTKPELRDLPPPGEQTLRVLIVLYDGHPHDVLEISERVGLDLSATRVSLTWLSVNGLATPYCQRKWMATRTRRPRRTGRVSERELVAA